MVAVEGVRSEWLLFNFKRAVFSYIVGRTSYCLREDVDVCFVVHGFLKTIIFIVLAH